MLVEELSITEKSSDFYFHIDVSVMIEKNVKGKFTTFLLSTMTIGDN